MPIRAARLNTATASFHEASSEGSASALSPRAASCWGSGFKGRKRVAVAVYMSDSNIEKIDRISLGNTDVLATPFKASVR